MKALWKRAPMLFIGPPSAQRVKARPNFSFSRADVQYSSPYSNRSKLSSLSSRSRRHRRRRCAPRRRMRSRRRMYTTSRQVTFCKRSNGALRLKRAYELSVVLCDAECTALEESSLISINSNQKWVQHLFTYLISIFILNFVLYGWFCVVWHHFKLVNIDICTTMNLFVGP